MWYEAINDKWIKLESYSGRNIQYLEIPQFQLFYGLFISLLRRNLAKPNGVDCLFPFKKKNRRLAKTCLFPSLLSR